MPPRSAGAGAPGGDHLAAVTRPGAEKNNFYSMRVAQKRDCEQMLSIMSRLGGD